MPLILAHIAAASQTIDPQDAAVACVIGALILVVWLACAGRRDWEGFL